MSNKLLEELTESMRKTFGLNELQISTVRDYISKLSTTSDFPEVLRWKRKPLILHSSLKEVFLVPRLFWSHLQIHKCQLIQAFLAFLLQLLYHNTLPILNNLEKELRFLLTILGDISWMLLGCHEMQTSAQFQNLMLEFESVANQAGCFLHTLLKSDVDEFKVVELDAVLHSTTLLKATLQSSDFITTLPCTTPKTSVANSFLLLDSLLDDLQELLEREDGRIADLKDQIDLLHQGLTLLHSSMNHLRSPKRSEIGELKETLMRIGDVAHQAQYLITAFLVEDAPFWYVIARLTHLNQRIQLITTELQVITEKYEFGGFKVTKTFSAQSPLQDERKNDSNEVMVGFEDEALCILNQLAGGGTEGRLVISIFGMPGLGKTTLAKKLYNHLLVRDWFEKRSWCVVSQTYRLQSILIDILIDINNDLGKDRILNMEEETLIEHIYKTLKGRRYLIVMDDVWDSSLWYELQRCFPDDGNGSRILVTSRNKNVAPPDSIIHELPFLSDEQCWELLLMKVFNSKTCPFELQLIGEDIAARCCGLPLTVIVIAGILSTVDEEVTTWEEVRGSLASYIKDGEDNTVMQILELSYKHLPDHLKPCFLFFGAYKEDQEVPVEKLKRLWIAEGFIRKENEKSEEDVAHKYLMELIDKSLVMVAKRSIDGRGKKACVVHDLLRDLCLKISQEENFLQYWNNEWYTISERDHRIRAFGQCASLSLCQHVHSFYGDSRSSSFYARDMRLLRVLHFNNISNWDVRSSIFGVEYLVNLRYLVIGEVPTWIEKLVNLEYLRARSPEKVYLPSTIVKLKKLRYIYAWKAEYSKDWICSSESNNNLEYLSRAVIKKLKDEELLKCSPRLLKLKCTYELMSSYLDEGEEQRFDLSFLTQLDSLSLSFLYTYPGFVLEDFGLPSNIRKLTLSWSRMPWEKMSILGRLENLEVLKLSRCAFQAEILESDRWDTRDGEFQMLRFLKMEDILLSEWNVESSEHFPKLQQLVLKGCSELEEIPSEIGEITTLELIEVKGESLDSLRESAERIKQEQREMGNEELKVIINTAEFWEDL